VRGTHDAETGSEMIEENGVVDCVDSSRERRVAMVDRIKEVNGRSFSRVQFAIND